MKNSLFLVILVFNLTSVFAQDENFNWKLGFLCGVGSEFKNSNYSYSNQSLKSSIFYTFQKTKHFEFEVLLQPEINFAQHQLLNLYFVQENETDFEQKREEFTKLKAIREYILSLGFVVRYPFAKSWTTYAVLSVGPMYTDTETERLSKGFAFCDVLSLGITYKIGDVMLDFRPNVRHTSNAGLQNSNAGFNTFNLDFGVVYGF